MWMDGQIVQNLATGQLAIYGGFDWERTPGLLFIQPDTSLQWAKIDEYKEARTPDGQYLLCTSWEDDAVRTALSEASAMGARHIPYEGPGGIPYDRTCPTKLLP